MAILQPMIVPVIGVQIESGPLQITPNEVLRCKPAIRIYRAIVEDKASEVRETILLCRDRTLVVKAIGFDPR